MSAETDAVLAERRVTWQDEQERTDTLTEIARLRAALAAERERCDVVWRIGKAELDAEREAHAETKREADYYRRHSDCAAWEVVKDFENDSEDDAK